MIYLAQVEGFIFSGMKFWWLILPAGLSVTFLTAVIRTSCNEGILWIVSSIVSHDLLKKQVKSPPLAIILS